MYTCVGLLAREQKKNCRKKIKDKTMKHSESITSFLYTWFYKNEINTREDLGNLGTIKGILNTA